MGAWLRSALYAPVALPGPRRRLGIVVAVVLSLASIPLSLLRQPGSAVDDPWAEDGTVFLGDAYAHPLRTVLLTPYAGYIAVYPRLVAAVAAHVGVPRAPLLLALGGALACAAAVGLTVVGSEGHLGSTGPRGVLGAAVALYPLAGVEIAASTCNAQWYLMAAAPWALLWRPRGAAGAALAATVLFFGASNDPLFGLLLPLAAARAIALPRVRDNAAGIGLVAGLVGQLPSLLHPALVAPASRPGAGALIASWLWRGPTEAVLSPRPAGVLGAGGLVAAALVLGLAVVVTGVVRGGRGRLAALLTGTGAVLYVVPGYLRWDPRMAALRPMVFASRYGLVPSVLSLTVCVLAVDAVLSRYRRQDPSPVAGGGRRTRAAPQLAVGLLAAGLVAAAVGGRHLGYPRTPSWSAQLPAARAACAVPGPPVGGAPADRPVTVALTGAPTAAWVTAVPCRLLTAG